PPPRRRRAVRAPGGERLLRRVREPAAAVPRLLVRERQPDLARLRGPDPEPEGDRRPARAPRRAAAPPHRPASDPAGARGAAAPEPQPLTLNPRRRSARFPPMTKPFEWVKSVWSSGRAGLTLFTPQIARDRHPILRGLVAGGTLVAMAWAGA